VVVGAGAAFLASDTQRAELFRVPAGADTEDEAAAGDDVEGGRLVGEHERRIVGRDEHGGKQPQPPRRGRHRREQHERVRVEAETAVKQAVSHRHVIEAEIFGVAGGAHVILVPEKEIDIDHVCALLKYNYDHGKHYGVVVVAEGCHLPEVGQVTGSVQVDSFGHARLSGIAEALAELIEKKTGYETRSVNLGHTQRGGVPTAYDRVLAQRYGLHAIDMVHDKLERQIRTAKGATISKKRGATTAGQFAADAEKASPVSARGSRS